MRLTLMSITRRLLSHSTYCAISSLHSLHHHALQLICMRLINVNVVFFFLFLFLFLLLLSLRFISLLHLSLLRHILCKMTPSSPWLPLFFPQRLTNSLSHLVSRESEIASSPPPPSPHPSLPQLVSVFFLSSLLSPFFLSAVYQVSWKLKSTSNIAHYVTWGYFHFFLLWHFIHYTDLRKRQNVVSWTLSKVVLHSCQVHIKYKILSYLVWRSESVWTWTDQVFLTNEDNSYQWIVCTTVFVTFSFVCESRSISLA